jgi:tRNA threonylcarbamoyl adenosine modification protein YjeE
LDQNGLERFARLMSQKMRPSDCVLLAGHVGAGKTTLARALIKALLITDEDVPSPTFTLVQTYATRLGPLWHADLYRLTSVDELEELGLQQAFGTELCIVEWPELLGDMVSDQALSLKLESASGGDSRLITATFQDPHWSDVLEACHA